MPTAWSDIKDEFRDTFRDTSTSFVDDAALLRMVRRVLRMIGSNYTYAFQEQRASITLTGATTYDLSTLLPGFKEILEITNAPGGSDVQIPMQYYDPKDFLSARDVNGYTIENTSTLRLYAPSTSSLTGSLTVIYYSNYMASSASGTRQQYPLINTDLLLIPEDYLDLVVEGLLMLAFRKDRTNREDYMDAKEIFTARLKVLQEEEPRRVIRAQSYAGASF